MDDKRYFVYGTKEIEYLKSKDAALGKAIDEIGQVRREVIPDLFAALVHSIIGQQISSKAHETVWARFQAMFAPVTPEHVHVIPAEELQTCGISMRKASYIKEIAGNVMEGSLNLAELQTLSDDDVCKRLTQINGIGTWTAEMLMIFSMGRMDVLSMGDMGIVRGLRMLYRHREITPKLFAKYKKRYSPYATVASLYLWQISHGGCAGLADPSPKAGGKKRKEAR